jgi:RNA polymerase sigma-70 factor (ECF subfamily)
LALARRAAGGDRASLHVVVDRHAHDLFRLARALCPTAADAEDAVQESLISVFRAIGTYDGRASLLTWMSRILFRRVRKMARKWEQRRQTTIPLGAVGEAKTADPVVAVDRADWSMDLTAALAKLPPEFREAVVLRELRGMSYLEIAKALGIPEGTVESRIHRARMQLRKTLAEYHHQ